MWYKHLNNKSRSLRVSRSQGLKVSRSQCLRVSRSQGVSVALSSVQSPQTPAYASTQNSKKFLQANIFLGRILHIINIRKDGIEICTGLLTEEIRA